MGEPSKVSLKDYAAARPFGCWVCRIPERQEIDEALKANVSLGVILRWLLDIRGYGPAEATDNKIRAHKRNGHHER